MDLEKKIKELREYFSVKFLGEKETKIEEKELKFSIIVLKDGTKISVDALEVGNVVSKVVGDSAEDLPAGEYEMEDGTILIVGEDSKIVEIKPKTDEEMAEETEEKPEEKPEESVSVEDKIAELDEKITKISESINILAETIANEILPYIQKTDEEMNNIEKVSQEMSSIFSSFKEEVESKFKLIEKTPFTSPQHFKNDRNEIDKNLSRSEQARLKMLDELNRNKK